MQDGSNGPAKKEERTRLVFKPDERKLRRVRRVRRVVLWGTLVILAGATFVLIRFRPSVLPVDAETPDTSFSSTQEPDANEVRRTSDSVPAETGMTVRNPVVSVTALVEQVGSAGSLARTLFARGSALPVRVAGPGAEEELEKAAIRGDSAAVAMLEMKREIEQLARMSREVESASRYRASVAEVDAREYLELLEDQAEDYRLLLASLREARRFTRDGNAPEAEIQGDIATGTARKMESRDRRIGRKAEKLVQARQELLRLLGR